MKTQKDDRRSQRTRQALHQALFVLMREKRYDAITVQDIIDQANVGRSTFYAHFVDKEDLASYSLEQIMEALMHNPAQGTPAGHGLIPTAALFEHVREQFPLFQMQMRGRGLELFSERAQAYWSQKIEQDLQTHLPPGQTAAVPLAVVARYVTGTWVTLLKWWLENKMPYTPERMDEIFQQLVLPGVRAALGRE
jgi:AcrR family transcriptional regulator